MLGRSPTLLLGLAGTVLGGSSGGLLARDCYGSSDASCNYLLQNCINSPGIWNSASCVAAATCAGMETFLDALCCTTGQCLTPSSQPSLDYNLYATIVGQCAWASGGCPITQQNYIDFYYGTLTNTGSSVWPSSSSVVGWWGAISAWAATGSSVPYTNFNDWLHYSSGPATPPSGGSGGGGSGGGGSGGGGGIIIVPPPVGGGGGGGSAGGGGGGGGGGGSGGGGSGGGGGGGGSGGGGSGGGGDPGDGDGDGDGDEDPQFCENEDTTGYKRDTDDTDVYYTSWMLNNTQTLANATAKRSAAIAWNYNIDCSVFPNICENWCYYVYCKGGSWGVHVDRNAGNRGQSACRSPNKCSYNCKGTGGWSLNPNSGWQCDEQPKNTNTEGGAGAATRCMTKKENGDEGNAWKSFINQAGSTNAPLANGQAVTVVLNNVNSGGLCASYGGVGTTHCPAAASPSDPLVQQLTNGHGSDNGIRQG